MRTKRNLLTVFVAEAVIMIFLLNFLTGCIRPLSGKSEGEGSDETESAQAAIDLPGALTRILLDYDEGSMEPHGSFLAEVTPEELVRAEYWPEKKYSPYLSEKEHEPVSAEQWADLLRAVTEIYPMLEEVPEDSGEDGNFTDENGEEIFVLDGGDYWKLFLTWRTEDGERTAQYYCPQDRRITTLVDLMRELADPIGRKIVWYEAPVIAGIYFQNEDGNYSFQLTEYDEGGKYYFIARYEADGEKTDLSEFVNRRFWAENGPWFSTLGLESFPAGSSFRDPLTVTMYYSDGMQKTVRPDEATAARMAEYFIALTEKVK